MGNRCLVCKTELTCMGGRSAHPSNWYCPVCDLKAEGGSFRAQLAEAHAEIAEQARLLGMSAEREARLLAKLAECERERDTARTELHERVTDLVVCERERDEARANYQFMVDRAADEKLDGYRELGQRAADAENRADRLQAFKDYVHARLDEAGVPVDPESPHKAAGCRIGGRLDWVSQRADRLEAAIRKAPHASNCASHRHFREEQVAFPCDCWKRDAREGK